LATSKNRNSFSHAVSKRIFGCFQVRKGKILEGIKLLKESKNYFLSIGDMQLLCEELNELGIAYYLQGDLETAAFYFKSSLSTGAQSPKESDAILLYAPHEIQDLEKLNDLRYPDSNQLKKLYTDLMNYLQVPAGIGEGQSFDFDIVDFATNFKWNVLQATYGLQAIAQEGLLYFNEQNFKPSKIVFTTSKEALYDFEHNNPTLEPIIKALLRSYEGIFDYPTNIHETRIAKISSTPIDLVRLKIQALHKYQVIKFVVQ
jgi:hypothetical protein